MKKEPIKLDAGGPKVFRVGTFDHMSVVSAYTTWYNRDWDGCVEFLVAAPSGTLAKKAAIKVRKGMAVARAYIDAQEKRK